MKNKFQNVAIVAVVLIALRCIFEKNSQRDYIVAVINIFALLVVVYLITEQIKAGFICNIKSYHVPSSIETREIRAVIIKLSLIVYGVFIIIALLYLLLLTSGLGNDIISIIALALSLCDDHIVSTVVLLHRREEN